MGDEVLIEGSDVSEDKIVAAIRQNLECRRWNRRKRALWAGYSANDRGLPALERENALIGLELMSNSWQSE